jgi:hypothetical protein
MKPTDHGAMPELLPCPFCGGAVQPRHCLHREDGGSDAVIHVNPAHCGTGDFSIDTADHGVSVAAAWNRRAAVEQAAVAVPEGWMRDEKQVRELLAHLVNTGWAQIDADGGVECVDQGNAMAAEVVERILLPLLASASAPAPRLDAPTSQINPGSAPRGDDRG